MAAAIAFLLCLPLAAFAQTATGPSGLALPRFATLRSEPVNVRVGPGFRYDVAWVYVKAALPVEIVQEFDVWRKIRDYDGQTGWVHQNLLSGKRGGVVTPWAKEGRVALRSGGSQEATVRAWLTPGIVLSVDSCDGKWCAATAVGNKGDGQRGTYSGYVRQADIWGVYENEKFK